MIFGDGEHAKVLRDIPIYPSNGWIVAIGDNAVRKKEVLNLEALWRYEWEPPRFGVAVHPSATVSPRAKIGEGSVICSGAVIVADAVIGKHNIINSHASVDHDCVLQDFVHIAPGAHLCGGVQVGEGGFVGTGVCLAPGYHVPEWTLIKARRIRPEDVQGIILV